MVAGFADWQADHHWVAEEVRAATEAYQADQDRLGGFLEDAGERKTFAQIWSANSTTLTRLVRGSGEERLGKIAFGKQLRERGFRPDQGRRWRSLLEGTAPAYGK